MEEIISQDTSLYARLLLGRARHGMLNARQKELTPYHISPRQAYILFILSNLGHKATLTELATHCDRGLNTLSIQMSKMEKDGLVKKAREVPKSTLLSFELTEKGMEIFKKSAEQKADRAIMSVLSEEERVQLIAMLQKIIKSANDYH
jgi:DNA-binding MarR family transcriptional regulator